MHPKTILVEKKDNIIYLTLNRPDKLNALSEEVLSELKEFLTGVKEDKFSSRGIIFTGAGNKAFIAGADIKAMDSMTPQQGETFGRLGQEVSLLFEQVPLPVIACVNGFALGGGCEMAMSCDMIYATTNAIFGQPEINLGLIPGFGGTQRLMRYVGLGHAREMIYTGRNVKAQEAFKIGLAQKIFETKEEMIAAAEKTLLIIKEKSPLIVAKCKEVINEGEGKTVSQGLELENSAFHFVFGTEDKDIGVKAFLEKKKADFSKLYS
ncbi:MAG: enoyl-CoA hydratase-related protein [Halobacteriovoraceae bacterium]|nr:enoyl-CoA hydratase-related protein [Halobacteriovoraceae bacterium]